MIRNVIYFGTIAVERNNISGFDDLHENAVVVEVDADAECPESAALALLGQLLSAL